MIRSAIAAQSPATLHLKRLELVHVSHYMGETVRSFVLYQTASYALTINSSVKVISFPSFREVLVPLYGDSDTPRAVLLQSVRLSGAHTV